MPMPCDIGYKSFSQVRIPTPTTQEFKNKTEAPRVNAELMTRIGQNDPEFVEWMNDLNNNPLLVAALKRALAGEKIPSGLLFTIGSSGNLEASGTYTNASTKRLFADATDRISRKWQMEVLRIVAELLDFSVIISETVKNGSLILILEAEKRTDAPVTEYLRITSDPISGSSMLFEHFASKSALSKTRDKFLALAEKLGVRITLDRTEERGSPIPGNAVHRGHLRENG